MIYNDNSKVAFNSFVEQPRIPYRIIEVLVESNSTSANNVWKLLKYPTYDALSKPNLSIEEKLEILWTPKQKRWEHEEDFSIFLKPLMGNLTDTAEQQTQIRLFRYNTVPESRMEAVIVYEFDVITNEKTSMVYDDLGIMCDRCDLLESYILDVLNGRDIGIGQNYLRYDRELSNSCHSLIGINNSKTFYGRSFFMALVYINPERDGGC